MEENLVKDKFMPKINKKSKKMVPRYNNLEKTYIKEPEGIKTPERRNLSVITNMKTEKVLKGFLRRNESKEKKRQEKIQKMKD